MSAEEEEKVTGGEEGGALTPKGEALPREAGDSGVNTGAPSAEGREEERATVRYRRRTARLRLGGIALAALVLLFAVVLISVILPHGSEGGSETTGAGETTGGEPVESGEESGEVRDLYEFDPALVPEGHVAIRPLDLSQIVGPVKNESGREVDLAALAARYEGIAPTDAVFTEPLVLILHTHTTEGYSPSGALSWDGTGELARSTDPSENVVAVGAALAEALEALGIPTLHCAVVHDADESGVTTNSGSYARAKETIERYLSEYPSICYVIDLHRDVVTDGDGNLVRAVSTVGDEAAAQLLTVVGSGDGISGEENLALALLLTETLCKNTPSLCREVVLKATDLNHGLSAHALTLEIGTAANALEEALATVSVLAPALAHAIRVVEAAE